jgi:hypothetical protein
MGELLTNEEKKELESRRRAAELQGEEPISPMERSSGKGGTVVSERAELEARRKKAGEMFEMG